MEGSTPAALVVDDDPALRMLMRVNLELDGFAVSEAANARRGRRKPWRAERPDVVLLDIHLGRDDTRRRCSMPCAPTASRSPS